MGESEFLNNQPHWKIPRRNGLFLAIINNFPYIMALPAIATIFGLHLPVKQAVGFSLVAFAMVWLFWEAYTLDLAKENRRHPHNKSWTFLARALKQFSILLHRVPPGYYTLIFWVLVTLLNGAIILIRSNPADLYLVWLLYVPVVIWPSFRLDANASNMFAVTWFASAVYVVGAYLYRIDFALDWVSFSSLVSHLTWFLFLSTFLHYLFRRLAIFRSQSRFLKEVIEKLRIERGYSAAFDARPITSAPDEHLNRIAWDIGEKLQYERVFIHVLDAEKMQLFMKGCYGEDPALWPEVGWPVIGQNSITGWVVENKEFHLCNDTAACELYMKHTNNSVCMSEAAVPIIVEDEVVGLIDVESSLKNAFDPTDIQLLLQIANTIGASLAYKRHGLREVNQAYQLLENTALKMVRSHSLEEALEQIAEQACTLFGADLVSIYRHAVSTRVPLPGLIFHGQARFPGLLGNKIPSNSRVNELLRNKEELYIQPFADTDDLLLGPNMGECTPEEAAILGHPLKFVRREGIKSTVYVKLGLGDEVVGSLFLNFRQRTHFQKNQVSALRAFAKILAMALILKRQVERANGPLAGAIPLSHSQAEAAFESVRRKFYEIPLDLIADCPKCAAVYLQLKEFSTRLELLERQWNNLILVEQRELRGSSLAEPIIHLQTKLRAMFPGVQLKWNVQEFLHIPTDEFGEMMYKVIAEGVSNALVHGKAGTIHVKSNIDGDHILLTISNNGIPINPGRAEEMNRALQQLSGSAGPAQAGDGVRAPHSESGSADEDDKVTGIFQILKDAWRWFGAQSRFIPDESAGTLLTVSFPLGNQFNQPEEAPDDDESED